MKHTTIAPGGAASTPTILPSVFPPAPAVMAILSRYERERLESFIAIAVDLLDVLDGDPDREDLDPDLEEVGAEDSFCQHEARGPGCSVSDPDQAADDVPCDDPHQDLEPEETVHGDYGLDQAQGPLPLDYSDDSAIRSPHIRRVRKERCIRSGQRDLYGRSYHYVGDR